MNETFLNETFLSSTEEVVGCLFLGGTTFSVCAYAIFLCYAIYDYQDEKPDEEKSPIDVLVKDLLQSQFWMLYSICLIGLISLFTPPITGSMAYLVSSLVSVFLVNFQLISLLILLYIQHLYVFYPDECANVDVSIMRRKSLIWKFILTFLSLFLSFLFPSPEVPLAYQMLAKGANYDR